MEEQERKIKEREATMRVENIRIGRVKKGNGI